MIRWPIEKETTVSSSIAKLSAPELAPGLAPEADKSDSLRTSTDE